MSAKKEITKPETKNNCLYGELGLNGTNGLSMNSIA